MTTSTAASSAAVSSILLVNQVLMNQRRHHQHQHLLPVSIILVTTMASSSLTSASSYDSSIYLSSSSSSSSLPDPDPSDATTYPTIFLLAIFLPSLALAACFYYAHWSVKHYGEIRIPLRKHKTSTITTADVTHTQIEQQQTTETDRSALQPSKYSSSLSTPFISDRETQRTAD